MTVKNLGTQSDTFLPSFATSKDVKGKIIYQDKYEYSSSTLLGYADDLHDKNLNPLSSVSGILAFSMPTDAANSGELILSISSGRDSINFVLK